MCRSLVQCYTLCILRSTASKNPPNILGSVDSNLKNVIFSAMERFQDAAPEDVEIWALMSETAVFATER